MPLAAKRLNILTNDSLPALATLGRAPLGALRLAANTPRIAVLFDMRLALAERLTTLGAEEVTDVPMGAQCHHVLAHDGSLAMFAARGEELVPIKVTVETQALVTVFGHSLAGLFGKDLASSPATNAVQTGRAVLFWFRRNFEGL